MGKRARLQRLPVFRAQPPTPLEQRLGRSPAGPAPHQRGGWRRDADHEDLDRDPEHDRYDEDDRPDDEGPTGHELTPCGPVERLVHDWAHWGRALEPRWPFRIAQALPPAALTELRRRIAPGTALPCPEVEAFARQHGCDPDAPVTTLAGLALRALRRREGHDLDPVTGWGPLIDALRAALARPPAGPGEGAASGEAANSDAATEGAGGPVAESDVVVVLAFHEAVAQAPPSAVRLLARAGWHEGWMPLAPWLLPAGDDRDEVLARTQGSWLALRQMREAQQSPPGRLLPAPRYDWWQSYEEVIHRLIRRGGASLRAPGYPSFVLAVESTHPDRRALTLRPLDPLTLARSENLAAGSSFHDRLLQALAPQHVRYGLLDAHGRLLPGYLSVCEAWVVVDDEPPAPALCVDEIHDPGDLLAGAHADVLALLEGVARSRGLAAPLVVLPSYAWETRPPPLATERRVQGGQAARAAAADPIVWNLYNDATHGACHRFYRAFAGGTGGRFRRPDPDESWWYGRAVRLAPLDAERDRVRAENLEEAFRLATSATGAVRATCRDQDGQMVGFTTG